MMKFIDTQDGGRGCAEPLPWKPSNLFFPLLTATGIACLLVPASIHAAAVVSLLPTDRSSGVTIEVVTPYEKLPSGGFMPARIRIGNQSGATRTWTITSESQNSYRGQHSHFWAGSFTVEHQAQAEVEVFLPMATLYASPHQSPSLRLHAAGVGCTGGGTGIAHARGHSGGGHGGGRAPGDPYRAVSDQLVAAIPYFATNAIPNSPTLDFRLAVEDFSAAHRAYHAIDQLWVTSDEWRGLPPAKAQAVAQWVRLGGDLVIAVSAGDAASALTAIPPGVLARPEASVYGFGRIQPFPLSGAGAGEEHVNALRTGAIARHPQVAGAHDAGKWKLRADIGNLSYPIVLILTFTIVFALLLGPVNLLIALRRRCPAQMLWTTPVFSLAAGVVLALVILLKDGTGGRGLRMTLAFLDPHSRTLSTLQEQVSLTGVLFGDGFAIDADTLITPLQTETRVDQRNRNYRETDGHLSGAWFGSRSIQAQLLERAQPTRQRIERVPASGPDEPPVLQSAVAQPLQEVFFRDRQGHLWHTPVLHTGERKPLDRVAPDAFRAWWNTHREGAGARMRMAFDRLDNVNGMFYAEVGEADDFTIETLPSIRWRNRAVILAGLVETQGAP